MSSQTTETKRLRDVLGKLISWIAQSANSPISVNEATELLDDLYAAKKRREGKRSKQ